MGRGYGEGAASKDSPILDERVIVKLSFNHGRRRRHEALLDFHADLLVSCYGLSLAADAQLDEDVRIQLHSQRVRPVGHHVGEGSVPELLDVETELAHTRLGKKDTPDDGHVREVHGSDAVVHALDRDDVLILADAAVTSAGAERGALRCTKDDGVAEDHAIVLELHGCPAGVEVDATPHVGPGHVD